MAASASDDELELLLELVTADQWKALVELSERLVDDWSAPDVVRRVSEPGNDGEPHFPWVEYGGDVRRVLAVLQESGIVSRAVHWTEWYSPDRYPDGVGLEDAPIADVVRMVTSIVRGDRFTEGTIRHVIDNGVFLVLLRPLCQWRTDVGAP